MRLAGIVMGKASDAVIEKGRKIAAHMLETAEDDIAFAAGRFTVKGTDRSVESLTSPEQRRTIARYQKICGDRLPPPAMKPSGNSAFPTVLMSVRWK